MTRPRPREYVWMALAALLAALAMTGAVEQNTMDHELKAAGQENGALRVGENDSARKMRGNRHSDQAQMLGAHPAIPGLNPGTTNEPAPAALRDCLKIRVVNGKAEWLRWSVRQENHLGFVTLECHYGAVWKAVANEHMGYP